LPAVVEVTIPSAVAKTVVERLRAVTQSGIFLQAVVHILQFVVVRDNLMSIVVASMLLPTVAVIVVAGVLLPAVAVR